MGNPISISIRVQLYLVYLDISFIVLFFDYYSFWFKNKSHFVYIIAIEMQWLRNQLLNQYVNVVLMGKLYMSVK